MTQSLRFAAGGSLRAEPFFLLTLGTAEIRNVDTRADVSGESTAGRFEQRHCALTEPAILPIVTAHAVLRAERLARLKALGIRRQQTGEIVRMHVLRPAKAELLC